MVRVVQPPPRRATECLHTFEALSGRTSRRCRYGCRGSLIPPASRTHPIEVRRLLPDPELGNIKRGKGCGYRHPPLARSRTYGGGAKGSGKGSGSSPASAAVGHGRQQLHISREQRELPGVVAHPAAIVSVEPRSSRQTVRDRDTIERVARSEISFAADRQERVSEAPPPSGQGGVGPATREW